MIISVEYENGVLKVTPPLDAILGKKLAEATLYAAQAIEDGRDPFPDESDKDAEEELEELKDAIRNAVSTLESHL